MFPMSQRVVSGEAIKAIREAKRLSLRDLAEVTGVSAAHLCRIENGDRTPTDTQARQIAKALGVPLAAIAFSTRVVVIAAAPEEDAA